MRAFIWVTTILVLAAVATCQVQEPGWWRNTVFYQIVTRSFRDTDKDGNGDFAGVISKLDYLKELGVGAIILTPIQTSPQYSKDTKDCPYKYCGHSIIDYRDVDGFYNTREKNFTDLVNAAHNKSIKVVLDFVPNHSSVQSYWFQRNLKPSPGKYQNYYVVKPTTGEKNDVMPTNWISVYNQSAWMPFPEGAEKKTTAYLHQFRASEPDLNYHSADVREEMENILEFWLNRGIDGFRINAIDYLYEEKYENEEHQPNVENPKNYNELKHTLTKDNIKNYELIKQWRNLLDNYAKNHNTTQKVLITEANTDVDKTVKYFEYGSDIPLNFDFIQKLTKDSKPEDFKAVIDEWLQKTANYTPSWMLGNHDKSRVATRFPERSDQMNMLAMILPGIVITYYGEEIAMEDNSKEATASKEANAEEKAALLQNSYKTPFLWSAETHAGFSGKEGDIWLGVNDKYQDVNLKVQREKKDSPFKLYTELVKMRNSTIVANGTTKTEILKGESETEGHVLAVVRQKDEASLVLLINFSNDKEQIVSLSKYAPGAKEAIVQLGSIVHPGNGSEKLDINKIKLEPKVSMILTMKNGAGFIMASVNLVLAASLLLIFRLN